MWENNHDWTRCVCVWQSFVGPGDQTSPMQRPTTVQQPSKQCSTTVQTHFARFIVHTMSECRKKQSWLIRPFVCDRRLLDRATKPVSPTFFCGWEQNVAQQSSMERNGLHYVLKHTVQRLFLQKTYIYVTTQEKSFSHWFWNHSQVVTRFQVSAI